MPRNLTGTVNFKDGRWQARVTLKNGKRPWIDIGGDLKPGDEAKAREIARGLAEWARDHDAVSLGKANGEPPVTGETVSAWCKRWCAIREARGYKSIRTDRARLETHVFPAIGEMPMVTITRRHLEDLVARLDRRVRAGELSWKTTINIWAVISKMFSDAHNAKDRSLRVCETNPADGVAPPDRGVHKAKVYLWPSEFLALVSCDKISLQWRRLFAIAVYTYARAGELEALDWSDLDLGHGVIHIHSAIDYDTGKVGPVKTKEARRFRIEGELLPLLKVMHEEAKGVGRVINPMPGRKELAGTLRHHLREAEVTRAALFADDTTRKNMTFHDLRSSGITWAAVRGDDPLKIKQRAGHSTFSTTEGYIREAEAVREGFGEVFPPLPASLLNRPANVPPGSEQGGGGANSHDSTNDNRRETPRNVSARTTVQNSSPPPRTLEGPETQKVSGPSSFSANISADMSLLGGQPDVLRPMPPLTWLAVRLVIAVASGR